ncbi:MAG TPA: pectate lyase [Pirellulales bacterium]
MKSGRSSIEHSRAARSLVGLTLLSMISVTIFGRAIPVAQAAEPIATAAFGDGIRHWKNGHNVENYSAYEPTQVRQIADNLLLYQRANGGWPPNIDPLRVLTEEERRELAAERDRQDTSFDNRATYPEVDYLAAAYEQTKDERYRDAAARGIEFILTAQYDNGGWPHSYPPVRSKKYHAHVTIVDDVMTGVLGTLQRIASARPPYDCFDSQLRDRVRLAHERGDRCLLNLQVRVGGELTGWSSQYDSVTLEPTSARSFELPALISAESVGVLDYLMAIEQPSPEVCRAIAAGVRWLERSQIRGLRIERIPAETVRYANHTSHDDVVAIDDPAAPPLWARFYEIDTNRPFMANRDGTKVFHLAEVARERRTGYSWYGGYATRLLERDYPAWQKKWGTP